MPAPARRAGARGSPRATCAPICFAAGATPGTGLPSCCTLARSPATKISRMPGHAEVAARRARARRGRSGTPSSAPSGEAARRRPTAPCARARALAAEARTPSASIALTGVPVTHFDAELAPAARALADSDSGNAASTRGPASTRSTCARARIDVAESRAACGARSPPACRRARRRSARRRRRRSSARPRARPVVARSARSNASSSAAADRQRVVERLQAGRVRAHSSWPKYECVAPVARTR